MAWWRDPQKFQEHYYVKRVSDLMSYISVGMSLLSAIFLFIDVFYTIILSTLSVLYIVFGLIYNKVWRWGPPIMSKTGDEHYVQSDGEETSSRKNR